MTNILPMAARYNRSRAAFKAASHGGPDAKRAYCRFSTPLGARQERDRSGVDFWGASAARAGPTSCSGPFQVSFFVCAGAAPAPVSADARSPMPGWS